MSTGRRRSTGTCWACPCYSASRGTHSSTPTAFGCISRQPTEQGYNGPITLYFRVDDVSATFDRWSTRGATVREAPEIAHRDAAYDLWLAFVSDPDGNNIGLMREAPKGLDRG